MRLKTEIDILQLLEARAADQADLIVPPPAGAPKFARCRPKRPLTNTQERLALLSSMSSLGFWHWNIPTDDVRASRHARNILGLETRVPLTPDALLAMIHPVDRAAVVRAINAAAHGEMVEMELRVLRPDRKIRWITAKARANRDARGMLSRVVGYVMDDSNRKRAEAQLLDQQRQITHLTRVAMLGELSGALAHELQQPLTAILCNAQAAQLLAAKQQFNAGELREILQDIVSADKRAGEIIRSLRSMLMRGEIQLQSLSIRELICEVSTLAHATLIERNVQLSARIEEGIPAVQGDRIELQQVLLNLVLNACESMSANAAEDRRIEIVVALEANEGVVRTSVLDRGKGIEPDQSERIFEPFFTTKKSGLGLGLAVCRSIIAAHKGRLWATSRADRGAAFHFTVALAAKE